MPVYYGLKKEATVVCCRRKGRGRKTYGGEGRNVSVPSLNPPKNWSGLSLFESCCESVLYLPKTSTQKYPESVIFLLESLPSPDAS